MALFIMLIFSTVMVLLSQRIVIGFSAGANLHLENQAYWNAVAGTELTNKVNLGENTRYNSSNGWATGEIELEEIQPSGSEIEEDIILKNQYIKIEAELFWKINMGSAHGRCGKCMRNMHYDKSNYGWKTPWEDRGTAGLCSFRDNGSVQYDHIDLISGFEGINIRYSIPYATRDQSLKISHGSFDHLYRGGVELGTFEMIPQLPSYNAKVEEPHWQEAYFPVSGGFGLGTLLVQFIEGEGEDFNGASYMDLNIDYFELVITDKSGNDWDDDQDGFTENEGDCNDDNPHIYPGAKETEGDNIDSDCDGVGATDWVFFDEYLEPATIYVDGARPDDEGDGRSWTNAKQKLTAALAMAEEGDVIYVSGKRVLELTNWLDWGKPGVGFSYSLNDQNYWQKSKYTDDLRNLFPSGVKLYGGFDVKGDVRDFYFQGRTALAGRPRADLNKDGKVEKWEMIFVSQLHPITFRNVNDQTVLDGFTTGLIEISNSGEPVDPDALIYSGGIELGTADRNYGAPEEMFDGIVEEGHYAGQYIGGWGFWWGKGELKYTFPEPVPFTTLDIGLYKDKKSSILFNGIEKLRYGDIHYSQTYDKPIRGLPSPLLSISIKATNSTNTYIRKITVDGKPLVDQDPGGMDSSPIIRNCSIRSNPLIKSIGSSPNISDCYIRVLSGVSGMQSDYDVWLVPGESPGNMATFENCTFVGSMEGVVAGHYGSFIAADGCPVTIKNCTMSSVLALRDSHGSTIVNTRFDGSAFLINSDPRIIGCLFTRPLFIFTTEEAGDHTTSPYFVSPGPHYTRENVSPSIINCTFSGFMSEYGSQSNSFIQLKGFTSPRIINSVFGEAKDWKHGWELYTLSKNRMDLRMPEDVQLINCIIHTGRYAYGLDSHIKKTKVIENTALNFEEVEHPNCLAKVLVASSRVGSKTESGAHLRNTSDGINMADPAFIPLEYMIDIEGFPRNQNGGVDVGAFGGVVLRATHYVDIDAGGRNDGSSWDNAYRNLQDALSVSFKNDQIWVAEGTYYTDAGCSEKRNCSFEIPPGIKVYGGFSGNETHLDGRNVTYNTTILSGDLSPYNGELPGNSYHVVTFEATTMPTILDGFTVTMGNANGDILNDKGGGLYLAGSHIKLSNLIVTRNHADDAGGGMFANNSNPSLTNVTFTNNTAGYKGGGLMIFNSASTTLTDVAINNNRTLRRNALGTPFGTIGSSLGGGGLYVDNSRIILSRFTIEGNNSEKMGGGMAVETSVVGLSNGIISGNNAADAGGGLYTDFNDLTSGFTAKNVTISANLSNNSGGGVHLEGGTNNNITFQNCIIWGNNSVIDQGNQVKNNNSGSTIYYHTNVEASGAPDGWSLILGTNGGNNIAENPRFVTTVSPGTAGGDYHLSKSSRSVDAGNNDFWDGFPSPTDLEGNPRVEGIVDLGAYESTNPRQYISIGRTGNSLNIIEIINK